MPEYLIGVNDIIELIEKAKTTETKTHDFQHFMEKRARRIHLTIGLQGEHPEESLVRFAIDYIEMIPRLIECVQACAKEAKTETLFIPFIHTAFHYFIRPSVEYVRYQSLGSLLINAYLCHRLMEEMYENNRATRNSELCAIETTQANLLAHELIGEPFANELDQSLELTAKKLAGSPGYFDLDLQPFVREAQHQSWLWMRHYWQSLLKRNHIEFQFSYKNMF